MHRGSWVLVVGAVALGAMAAASWQRGVDPRSVVGDQMVGWSFLAAGVLIRDRRRGTRIGVLMIVTGGAWFLGTVLPVFAFLHRGPLAHLLATYPSGRLTGRIPAAFVGASYVLGLLPPLARNDALSLPWAVGLGALGVHGMLASRGIRRRAAIDSGLASIAIGVVLAMAAAARFTGSPIDPIDLYAYEIVLAGTAITLATDLLAGRWSKGLLTRLIIDLGDPGQAGSVRQRLAGAVGDPSLVVGYAVDGSTGSFVDETGSPVARPQPTSKRIVFPLIVEKRDVGFITGDPTVLDDPLLRDAVATAAELAMANGSMQAQMVDRVRALDASRARLVGAADSQRRRIESLIQAGPAARLDHAAEVLAAAQQRRPDDAPLQRFRDDLDAARAELRGFALGVHPVILSSAGLAAAIEDLARRTPLPLAIDVTEGRYGPLTESTLYFVCAEAVANVIKHAEATTVEIGLRHVGTRLRLRIEDDGVGGAAVGARGGLRGLVDRVEALGGRLTVEVRPGHGTRLVAELPWSAGPASIKPATVPIPVPR
jgi:signal transduction histidine kinase